MSEKASAKVEGFFSEHPNAIYYVGLVLGLAAIGIAIWYYWRSKKKTEAKK